MSRKKKARDRRLRKKYGISLREYGIILRRQGGGCAICGSTKKKVNLHVDHDHKARRSQRKTWKRGPREWRSSAVYKGVRYLGKGETKGRAIRALLDKLKRASVRGILCFPCNRGLRVFNDRPRKLVESARYLRRHNRGETHVPERKKRCNG